MARKQLSHEEKVVKAVGRRPLNRNQVAAKLGMKPQAVARALGKATQEGKLVKTDKGYVQGQ
jgi:predicted Rossmann fold nucleotide-binding protein DprA/Smf involved in DNA uptake